MLGTVNSIEINGLEVNAYPGLFPITGNASAIAAAQLAASTAQAFVAAASSRSSDPHLLTSAGVLAIVGASSTTQGSSLLATDIRVAIAAAHTHSISQALLGQAIATVAGSLVSVRPADVFSISGQSLTSATLDKADGPAALAASGVIAIAGESLTTQSHDLEAFAQTAVGAALVALQDGHTLFVQFAQPIRRHVGASLVSRHVLLSALSPHFGGSRIDADLNPQPLVPHTGGSRINR